MDWSSETGRESGKETILSCKLEGTRAIATPSRKKTTATVRETDGRTAMFEVEEFVGKLRSVPTYI